MPLIEVLLEILAVMKIKIQFPNKYVEGVSEIPQQTYWGWVPQAIHWVQRSKTRSKILEISCIFCCSDYSHNFFYVSTGNLWMSDFICPRKKQSKKLQSGYHTDQAKRPCLLFLQFSPIRCNLELCALLQFLFCSIIPLCISDVHSVYFFPSHIEFCIKYK